MHFNRYRGHNVQLDQDIRIVFGHRTQNSIPDDIEAPLAEILDILVRERQLRIKRGSPRQPGRDLISALSRGNCCHGRASFQAQTQASQ